MSRDWFDRLTGVPGRNSAETQSQTPQWFAGAATVAAVVLALRQSEQARREARRAQLAQLVDHEVSRRRECLRALAELWGALASIHADVRALVYYLNHLPAQFDRHEQRRPGFAARTYEDEIAERMREFVATWMDKVEPPLITARYLLDGTPARPAVEQINDGSNEIRTVSIPAITRTLMEGQRPDTASLETTWNTVMQLRDEHLELARQHFSLTRKDIEQYVRQNDAH